MANDLTTLPRPVLLGREEVAVYKGKHCRCIDLPLARFWIRVDYPGPCPSMVMDKGFFVTTTTSCNVIGDNKSLETTCLPLYVLSHCVLYLTRGDLWRGGGRRKRHGPLRFCHPRPSVLYV
ncbi:hypothetical protein Bbelb_404470 [Branchiostoma belcheri]|nr:hypothetical protein Bbelb_404470 [Branchiostoma belcheri]